MSVAGEPEIDLLLDPRLICDLEMLTSKLFPGVYEFMDQENYLSVVKDLRLKNGKLWPMPIVLPISQEEKDFIEKCGDATIYLSNELTLQRLAVAKVQNIYEIEYTLECENVYGTLDTNHPYLQVMEERKNQGKRYYLGTKNLQPVKGVKFHEDFLEYRETSEEIQKRIGPRTLVGFQTRNPSHRSHVELMRFALRQTNDPDAILLLQPVVGVTQSQDIDYITRVECYKCVLDKFPPGKVVLNLLPLSMRMAGPREALWHALIRKGFGCTHFVVGRDHSGPSTKTKEGKSFYDPYAAHALLETFQSELGIKIITSQMIVYVPTLNKYLPLPEVPEGCETLRLSGTQLREMIRKKEPLPEWFTYPEIAAILSK